MAGHDPILRLTKPVPGKRDISGYRRCDAANSFWADRHPAAIGNNGSIVGCQPGPQKPGSGVDKVHSSENQQQCLRADEDNRHQGTWDQPSNGRELEDKHLRQHSNENQPAPPELDGPQPPAGQPGAQVGDEETGDDGCDKDHD